jgi:lysozyme
MHFSTCLLTLSTLFATTLSSPLAPRACTGPPINAATLALIKEFEGFVASPAPDPIGLPTVGYGHLCQTSGCAEVPYAFPLSESTASALLASDVKVSHRTSLSVWARKYVC